MVKRLSAVCVMVAVDLGFTNIAISMLPLALQQCIAATTPAATVSIESASGWEERPRPTHDSRRARCLHSDSKSASLGRREPAPAGRASRAGAPRMTAMCGGACFATQVQLRPRRRPPRRGAAPRGEPHAEPRAGGGLEDMADGRGDVGGLDRGGATANKPPRPHAGRAQAPRMQRRGLKSPRAETHCDHARAAFCAVSSAALADVAELAQTRAPSGLRGP
mgnify:CR=1 FL=1